MDQMEMGTNIWGVLMAAGMYEKEARRERREAEKREEAAYKLVQELENAINHLTNNGQPIPKDLDDALESAYADYDEAIDYANRKNTIADYWDDILTHLNKALDLLEYDELSED